MICVVRNLIDLLPKTGNLIKYLPQFELKRKLISCHFDVNLRNLWFAIVFSK